MALLTRKLDNETFTKTEKYLRYVRSKLKEPDKYENVYFYMLQAKGGLEDGKILDALILLQDNKFIIKSIWIMIYDHKTGIPAPINQDGEKGEIAKILAEKYYQYFFEHLETVDMDNIGEECFTITPDLVNKVEADIDRCIDPKHITTTDINAYDRVELIYPAEANLRRFCEELGEANYIVSYNKDTQVFSAELIFHKIKIEVSLADVVHKKWETGEHLTKALIRCAGELIIAAKKQ